MSGFKVLAPNAAPFSTFVAKSGNTYTADSTGQFSNVVGGDVGDVLSAGGIFVGVSNARNNYTATTTPTVNDDVSLDYAVGSLFLNTNTGKFYLCTDATDGAAVWAAAGEAMSARLLSLMNVKLPTGLQLAATAAANVFGLSLTVGTSGALIGEAANSNTKTDSGIIDFVVPDNYTAGRNLTVTLNAKIAGAGTAGSTKTIDLEAYEMSTAGAAGSDICATAAQTLTTSNANYAFTITGTDLLPGDLITFKITTALQETGGTNINAQINSIKVAQA